MRCHAAPQAADILAVVPLIVGQRTRHSHNVAFMTNFIHET